MLQLLSIVVQEVLQIWDEKLHCYNGTSSDMIWERSIRRFKRKRSHQRLFKDSCVWTGGNEIQVLGIQGKQLQISPKAISSHKLRHTYHASRIPKMLWVRHYYCLLIRCIISLPATYRFRFNNMRPLQLYILILGVNWIKNFHSLGCKNFWNWKL